jgi:SAM-dependent methyltransferase
VQTARAMTTPSDDYVLGTHDEEIERLELQHAVWRSRAIEAWDRADVTPGITVVDLGCGPGFAAVDLARRVGPTGRVIAVDRSRRFLDLLASRGVPQIELVSCDLDADDLPVSGCDAVWARWVFCFVQHPRELVARVARALRPGGRFVAHEYIDYGTWRTAPREIAIEEFVADVMSSWRARGGEPDIGLELPSWLSELGFEVTSLRPIVEMVAPGTPYWRWLQGFGEIGLQRLVELGHVSTERADQIAAAWAACAARPGLRMVTPAVLEIVATRR